ncbi:hypothetical protein EJB05_11011 [Eragrostis curvula]|uniref:Uncharacterized protein n=1 Tax=Eragrostis curvula TaxID=38414 RepID=A0A5J9VNE7_9POAL|nr:hypothetical protein EJB05_11011 [Eragrostis curvula]
MILELLDFPEHELVQCPGRFGAVRVVWDQVLREVEARVILLQDRLVPGDLLLRFRLIKAARSSAATTSIDFSCSFAMSSSLLTVIQPRGKTT